MNELYNSPICCSVPVVEDLADEPINWDEIYNEITKQLLETNENFNWSLYQKTAENLTQALKSGLKYSSTSSKEDLEKLSNALQSNLFFFSRAKTTAQMLHYRDLMVNEKKEIISFDSLKKLVANEGEIFNNQYLKTEYNLTRQSAIMAVKWQELDAEYLQFSTVGDKRVRPEHKLFDKFTAKKSDPIWKRLYTPLDWGCRCTIRPGKESGLNSTYNSEWANKMVDPLVKNTIFDNNVGITLEIFNKTHPYFIALTIINKPNSDRYSGVKYRKEKGIKNKGVLEIFTSGKQNKNEFKKNLKAFKIAANSGKKYRMLPIINDNNNNPDGWNLKSKHFVDVKVSEGTNGKNIIQSAMKEANRQKAKELLLHLTKKPKSYKDMYAALRHTINEGRNKNVETITVIFPDESIKEYSIDSIRKKIRKR